MQTKYIRTFIVGLLLAFVACSPKGSNVIMPEGPEGPEGPVGKSAYEVWRDSLLGGKIANWDTSHNDLANYAKYLLANRSTNGGNGKAGESAYEMWKRMVTAGEVDNPFVLNEKWNDQETQMSDFWRFLTGAKGENGGIPRIEGGYWFIGNTPLTINGEKVKAQGSKGKPGAAAQPPVLGIDAEGNWTINNTPLLDANNSPIKATAPKGKDGADGSVPTVSVDSNGNWVITYPNGKKTVTSTPAKGQKGNDVVITIDPNTHHWIITQGGVVTDTGISAFGAEASKGIQGVSGDEVQSIYDLWKSEVEKGLVPAPNKSSGAWEKTLSSPTDFWYFISSYKTDEDKQVAPIYSIAPLPILPILNDYPEYVSRKTGKATFQVYKNGEPVGAGFQISEVPFLFESWDAKEPVMQGSTLTFTTDDKGQFTIDNMNLPKYGAFTNTPGGYANSLSDLADLIITGPTNIKLGLASHYTRELPIYVQPYITDPTDGSKKRVDAMLIPYRATIHITIERAMYISTDKDYPNVSFNVQIRRERGDGRYLPNPQPMEEGAQNYQDYFEVFVIKDPDELSTWENLITTGIDPSIPTRSKFYYKGYLAKDSMITRAYVRRPYILHEDEKSVRAELLPKLLDFVNQVYAYKTEENAPAVYVSVATQEEYGRRWVAYQKVKIPPIYPAPNFDKNKVYYDESKKVLFGSLDQASFKPFFHTDAHRAIVGGDDYVNFFSYSDKSTSKGFNAFRWEPRKDRGTNNGKPNTYIPFNTRIAFKVTAPDGRIRTSYTLVIRGDYNTYNFHFVIEDIEPESLIHIRPDIDGKDSQVWRGRDAYILKKENDTYKLVSPLHVVDSDKSTEVTVQKAEFESDWLKSKKDTPKLITQP